MTGLLGYCETKAEEDWHLEQERQAYEAARDAEEWDQMQKRVAKLETALGNLVRFDRGDTAIARGNYQNLMAEACEALGGDWKP
jgi:DUF1365 family protein